MGTNLTKAKGISIARRFKERLQAQGIPVVGVYLFGSLARGVLHEWTDVDVAVVHEKFDDDRHAEHTVISSARENFDVPMDIICLRREDLESEYSSIVQEVKKHGVPV